MESQEKSSPFCACSPSYKRQRTRVKNTQLKKAASKSYVIITF
ncbi:hypothetical protein GTCCBUS3UF5_16170 [Geobacillus thermoleovorans CCB_US3_UF5]|uniref:Uncharacterized protein n=2 Tax=Geobacillus TaxID=129337 RepID=A0A1Q5SJQ6_9BACL|nr:hypothetical protein GTCCBUS3UF5_16170 [Geobacillus thermoleovorans CCB_US3_UF5]OKO88238.1 hypothetical protein BRO54_3713 [Geobacillus proteiniphilus]GAJ59257.1 hypothetical protein B23_2481 [Geobacillus thermoleovorans B23]